MGVDVIISKTILDNVILHDFIMISSKDKKKLGYTLYYNDISLSCNENMSVFWHSSEFEILLRL